MLDYRLAQQINSLAHNYSIANIIVYSQYDINADYITSVKVNQTLETEKFLKELETILCTFWKGKLISMNIKNLHVEYVFHFKHNHLPLMVANFFDYKNINK